MHTQGVHPVCAADAFGRRPGARLARAPAIHQNVRLVCADVVFGREPGPCLDPCTSLQPESPVAPFLARLASFFSVFDHDDIFNTVALCSFFRDSVWRGLRVSQGILFVYY